MALRNRVKPVSCQAEGKGIFLSLRKNIFTAMVNLMEGFHDNVCTVFFYRFLFY